jgi:hypothetical protein
MDTEEKRTVKKFHIFVPLVLVLVSALFGCAGNPSAQNTRNALFFDDFSQTTGSWTRQQDATGSMGYENAHYNILVSKKDSMLIATAGKSFQDDVSIEVDARKVGGSENNYFGVVCRYQNPDNYYMFLVTSDGLSGILMNKNGVMQMISPGANWLKMAGIKSGSVTNHIRVDCVGEALVLYANGKQVSNSFDHTFVGGDAGLVARSSRLEGGVEIQFDNFMVNKPSQP